MVNRLYKYIHSDPAIPKVIPSSVHKNYTTSHVLSSLAKRADFVLKLELLIDRCVQKSHCACPLSPDLPSATGP